MEVQSAPWLGSARRGVQRAACGRACRRPHLCCAMVCLFNAQHFTWKGEWWEIWAWLGLLAAEMIPVGFLVGSTLFGLNMLITCGVSSEGRPQTSSHRESVPPGRRKAGNRGAGGRRIAVVVAAVRQHLEIPAPTAVRTLVRLQVLRRDDRSPARPAGSRTSRSTNLLPRYRSRFHRSRTQRGGFGCLSDLWRPALTGSARRAKIHTRFWSHKS